jgi:colanic acid/amylovoran biosynthesis glycosyltransferase
MQRPSKIAYLGAGFPSLSETFIYREVMELERRGYRLELYSIHHPDRDKFSKEAVPLGQRCYYLLPVAFTTVVLAHLYFLLSGPVRYVRTFLDMVLGASSGGLKQQFRTVLHFGEAAVLARRLQKDRITHLHAHYASHPASIARIVFMLTGIPFSFSAHAYDIWAQPLLLAKKLKDARFVACCSRCGSEELRRQGSSADQSKVHLIYHGIDTHRFSPADPQSRQSNLILALGRLEDVKGFHILVEACRVLKDKGVSFECRIVGEGDERKALAGLIEKYNLKSHVKMPGAVTQEEILDHYHAAAIFAMPCVASADGRHDGIPNVLLEAMSTELPVVTTPIGGILEVVVDRENGLIVPSGDVEELSAKLALLLSKPELRQSLGRAGRERVVQEFDNRNTIEPLVQLLVQRAGLRAPAPARVPVIV